MRDLTIGLDASLTLILVGYYSILELHRKKGKTAPNLLSSHWEKEEKKSATTKRDWQFLQSVERLTVSCQQRWYYKLLLEVEAFFLLEIASVSLIDKWHVCYLLFSRREIAFTLNILLSYFSPCLTYFLKEAFHGSSNPLAFYCRDFSASRGEEKKIPKLCWVFLYFWRRRRGVSQKTFFEGGIPS